MLMRTPHRWVRPKRQLPPGFIVPCQPTLADKAPAGDGWIHELKHDGFRVLAFKDGDKVRLWSRNGRDWSSEFVAITEAMRALRFKRVMLDGEAVAHCLDGLPDFHRLLTGRPPPASTPSTLARGSGRAWPGANRPAPDASEDA
jgi:bifunctional non-homologous end joining protein LigD